MATLALATLALAALTASDRSRRRTTTLSGEDVLVLKAVKERGGGALDVVEQRGPPQTGGVDDRTS